MPSTIVDATGERPRLLRLGAIPVADLDAALADLGITVQVEPDPDQPDQPDQPEGQEAAPTDA